MKISKYLAVAITSTIVLLSSSCYITDESMRQAGVGAAVGGVTGAIIGNQHDKPITGAAIGAAAGATMSGYHGRQLEKQKQVNRSHEERIRLLEEEIRILRAKRGY